MPAEDTDFRRSVGPVALAWLWAVDGVRPGPWDVAGITVSLLGMGLIAFQPR